MREQILHRYDSSRPLFLVDFDLTLFNTTRFSEALFSSFASVCSLQVGDVEKSANDHYIDPILGGYDIELHAMSLGICPEKAWLLLDEILKTNFLYQDSALFLENLTANDDPVTILSFGERRFQTQKILQSLKHLSVNIRDSLDVQIVQERKTRYIQRSYPGKQGMLIDDIPNQGLPNGMLEVQIARGTTFSSPVWYSDKEVRVSSLEMIIDNLDELLRGSFTSFDKEGYTSTR